MLDERDGRGLKERSVNNIRLTKAFGNGILFYTGTGKGGAAMTNGARGSFYFFSYRFTGFAFRKADLRCTG
jgi:hypothetical protein